MLSGIGIKPRKTLRVQVDADLIAEHHTLIEAVVAMKVEHREVQARRLRDDFDSRLMFGPFIRANLPFRCVDRVTYLCRFPPAVSFVLAPIPTLDGDEVCGLMLR